MRLKVLWITWWPAPYWEPRFERLNTIDDIELKVFYIQKESTMHQWHVNNDRKYFHEFIDSKEKDGIGYKFRISNLFSVFKALKLFKEKGDVIILPYADIRFIVIILLCIIKRRKYFLFCVNTIMDERKENFLKEILKRILFVNASAILATGKAQKDYGSRYLTDSNKIKVVGNPAVEFRTALNRNSNSIIRSSQSLSKTIYLLYVGRLSKEKGLYDLLYSVSLLRNLNNNFKILMVGDGPEKEKLRIFSNKLRVDCRFTGFIKNLDQLNNMYKLADIFILPSYSEPWGLVVNEAMQNKLPVILSDKIGCKIMLLEEGVNGYSFKSGDSLSLSYKIRLMVNKNKRESMGQESYRIIQNQSPKSWVENVINAIYNTI